MKILFLRVGIDRGCGGTLSPLFNDLSFDYVPIPESDKYISNRSVMYSDIPALNGGNLKQYSNSNEYAHYDPEFNTYTYGEPSFPKKNQLLKLEVGDIVIFYSGFKGDTIDPGTCFVIGYFFISSVYHFKDNDKNTKFPESLSNNAHIRRSTVDEDFVLITGDNDRSRLLKKAIQLSDNKQNVLPEVSLVTGLTGSVKRAIGRWVKAPEEVSKTIEWVTSGK